jgi:hypothetical protein
MKIQKHITKLLQAILISYILLLAVSCGMPSENDVKTSFLKEHPEYTVLDIHVDEGDFDEVYFHIKYRKPKEDKIYGDMWLYLRNKNREMELFKKWTLADAENHTSMKAAD